jgi:hypothetical protein
VHGVTPYRKYYAHIVSAQCLLKQVDLLLLPIREEIQAAIESWERKLISITSGKQADNVIPIQRKKVQGESS